MKIKEFVEKLRNQPENVRKRILWATIIVIGLILFTLWAINIKKLFQEFKKEDFSQKFNFPDFQEDFNNMPSLEIPQPSEEELKEIEAEINKEMEKEAGSQNNNIVNPQ